MGQFTCMMCKLLHQGVRCESQMHRHDAGARRDCPTFLMIIPGRKALPGDVLLQLFDQELLLMDDCFDQVANRDHADDFFLVEHR